MKTPVSKGYNFLKKRLQLQVFSCGFYTVFGNTHFMQHLQNHFREGKNKKQDGCSKRGVFSLIRFLLYRKVIKLDLNYPVKYINFSMRLGFKFSTL